MKQTNWFNRHPKTYIICFTLLGIVALALMFPVEEQKVFNPQNKTMSDCSTVQAELDNCIELSLNMVDAWDKYDKTMDDYCELDPYNNLCLIR